MWRACNDNLLATRMLSGVPFFLCGGGARMKFYAALMTSLGERKNGFPWLYAVPGVLVPPDDLVIDDIAKAGYDRLSVAYGLSRLELGNVLKALPAPNLIEPPTANWTNHYVSKDSC